MWASRILLLRLPSVALAWLSLDSISEALFGTQLSSTTASREFGAVCVDDAQWCVAIDGDDPEACNGLTMDLARQCRSSCGLCGAAAPVKCADGPSGGGTAPTTPVPTTPPADLFEPSGRLEFEDAAHPGCPRAVTMSSESTFVLTGTDGDAQDGEWSVSTRPVSVTAGPALKGHPFVADFSKQGGSSLRLGVLSEDLHSIEWGDGGLWTLHGKSKDKSCKMCSDQGPWPCAEKGCPGTEVSCTDLGEGGACMVTFGYVFDFPPAGLDRTLIFMQCPETCGVCPYKKLVQEVVQPSTLDHAANEMKEHAANALKFVGLKDDVASWVTGRVVESAKARGVDMPPASLRVAPRAGSTYQGESAAWGAVAVLIISGAVVALYARRISLRRLVVL